MNIAFLFNGALTSEQEKIVKKNKGSIVNYSDYLGDFDLLVLGAGVVAPETDIEIKTLADFAKLKKKLSPKSKPAVISDAD